MHAADEYDCGSAAERLTGKEAAPGGDGMQKTVLIDGYNLGLEKGTGVATYARNLSYAAHAIGCRVEVLYGVGGGTGSDPLLREIAFFDPQPGESSTHWTRVARIAARTTTSWLGCRAQPVPVTGAVIAKPFESRLPYFDAIWNVPDLFSLAQAYTRAYHGRAPVAVGSRPAIAHWTYPLPLRIPGAKNIYTLHDLIPLRLPYATLDRKRRYFRLVRALAHRADRIVTVSENSKRDIVNLLGFDEQKIINTYQAADVPADLTTRASEAVRREIEGGFGVPFGEYFLFYGAIEPKKNLGRLIDSYLAAQTESPLVIVASEAWKSGDELRFLRTPEVANAVMHKRVRHFDYAPFSALINLIRGAKAVLFPSLYEGFGLPVLEAMQLGTPVMASNQASIPEIAGDAALLVDPYNRFDMADAIRRLDADVELRGSLRDKGLNRAQLFTPEKYQARLMTLYGSLG